MSRFLLLLVGIALVGCANPAQDSSTASLEGTFKSSYGDGFKVSGTEFVQYDNAALDVSFKGTIANSPDLTAESGTLIVKITDAGSWGKTVDTYYGIRWQGLNGAGVRESTAYAEDLSEPTTLDDAKSVFSNSTLYASSPPEYARQ